MLTFSQLLLPNYWEGGGEAVGRVSGFVKTALPLGKNKKHCHLPKGFTPQSLRDSSPIIGEQKHLPQIISPSKI